MDRDRAWVGAGDARGPVGADDEGVLDADHADAGDALLGLQGQHHPLGQRLVESARQDRQLVDLQADAVTEEVGPADAETAWTIAEDRDYPRLAWECRTLCPASLEGEVIFVDKNLEAAVENELCVCRPTVDDMLGLVQFSNSGWSYPKARIVDLTGIEYAVNLRTLSLPFHEVRFLSPLWGMTNLEHLDLRECPVRDLSPLSVLRRLSWLNLHKTAVHDISPLVGLTSLTFVDLRGTLLDLEAYEVHIPRLRAENPEITILYDPYR